MVVGAVGTVDGEGLFVLCEEQANVGLSRDLTGVFHGNQEFPLEIHETVNVAEEVSYGRLGHGVLIP